MATKAKLPTKKNPLRVAVLVTAEGQPLILRSNPTLQEVRGFVREHNRRFNAGEPGGPSGLPARQIVSAQYFESEDDLSDLEKTGADIDISGALAGK